MESKKLLAIGLVWPEPSATAAGVRMMQLLDVFIKNGYGITFVSSASKTEFSEDLSELGIETQSIELNNPSFDKLLKELKPNVVLFDRFLTEEQFGWRVAEHCPNALRVLDTEDLHSLRHVREKLQKQNLPFNREAWLQDDKTKREVASILRCDLSLIISDFELKLLTDTVKLDASLLYLLPFMYNEISPDNMGPAFEERHDFIFIGGGKHMPNVDAIKYLKKDIWPKIHDYMPNAKCHIYGAYLPQSVIQLHNPKKGFYVMGRAEKVSEVMQKSKVCLAPLRFGAGIKGKLMDAMLYGTPSTTTSIGAEGMHGKMAWNGFIVDDPDDFAKKAIKLYTEKDTWQGARDKGIQLVNTLFCKTKLGTSLMQQISNLREDFKNHRTHNFMGSLLQYQTLQSTKYMSKWIEEKNRKDN